jgi:hypothetical protein
MQRMLARGWRSASGSILLLPLLSFLGALLAR